ncbi:MAG: ATP-binding protein [Spirochaetales bacterium]|nr:ATP-binding protein [Spirochaetales bacterium]
MPEPIKLLDFYREEDAGVFFGRKEEREEIYSLIRTYPVVVLTGESGTGKTSLLRAGILPLLSGQTVIYHRLYAESRKSLIKELSSCLDNGAKGSNDFNTLLSQIQDGLSRKKQRLVLLLDQFEEFLMTAGDSPGWFDPAVLADVMKSVSLCLVFSLRSDYLPLFMTWLKPVRVHFMAEQFFYLQRMHEKKAINIISKMLEHHGVSAAHNFLPDAVTKLSRLSLDGLIYPPHIQILASHIVSNPEAVNNLHVESILSGYFNRELFRGIENERQGLVKDLLDILVGREGLRRKLSLDELSGRLQEPAHDLFPLLKTLIERRVIRRTEEDHYELIHDFLSKHFFEAFSYQERRKRRFQDMFNMAFMDFNDSNIYLDEKRIRLFLHYRRFLNLDIQGLTFIVRSLAALNYFMGECPYMDLSMHDVLLDLYRNEKNKTLRGSIIKKLKSVLSADDADIIRSFYENEDELYNRFDLLDLLAEIDPPSIKKIVLDHLVRWNELDSAVLENMILRTRDFSDPRFLTALADILKVSTSENIINHTIDALGYIMVEKSFELLLEYLENNGEKNNRINNSIITTLDNILVYGKSLPDKESLQGRLLGLLENLMEKQHGASNPDLYAVYLKNLAPDLEKSKMIFSKITDSDNFETAVNTLADMKDPEYIPLFTGILENTESPVIASACLRALRDIGREMDEKLLLSIYGKFNEKYVKADALTCINAFNPEKGLQMAREALPGSDTPGNDLFYTVTRVLAECGDNSDLENLEKLYGQINDLELKTHLVTTIWSFPEKFKSMVTGILEELWSRESDESIKITIGINLFVNGSTTPVSFLYGKLGKIDEQFEENMNQLFTLPQNEFISLFIIACLKMKEPLPAEETLKECLKEVIQYSANRQHAGLALLLYGTRFGDNPEDGTWITGLIENADYPELRGWAAITLTAHPGDDSLKAISRAALLSPYFTTRKLALYALGMLKLEGGEHNTRMEAFIKVMKTTLHQEMYEHAVWAFSGCAAAEDITLVENITDPPGQTSIWNEYTARLTDYMVKMITDKPLTERKLPEAQALYDIENLTWQGTMKLRPFFPFPR